MGHSHHTELLPPPSGEGTVMLDIGGDRGALVVSAPPSLDGAELELRPVGGPWQGAHTAVRRRHVRHGVSLAAVFGTLDAGRYQLRVKGTGTGPVLEAEVVGGSVAEVTWPALESPATTVSNR